MSGRSDQRRNARFVRGRYLVGLAWAVALVSAFGLGHWRGSRPEPGVAAARAPGKGKGKSGAPIPLRAVPGESASPARPPGPGRAEFEASLRQTVEELVASRAPLPHGRPSAVSRAFSHLDLSQIRWAVALADELPSRTWKSGPGGPQEYLLAGIMARWAELDPAAASSYLASEDWSEWQRSFLLREMVRGWAQRDIESAARWLKANGADFKSSGSGALALAHRLIDVDPGSALARARDLGLASVENLVWSRLVERAFYRSPEETVAWADALADDGDRKRAQRKILNGLRQTDPRGTLEYFAERNEELSSSAGLALSALGRWSIVDPEGAADWALAHENLGGVGGGAGLKRVFESWFFYSNDLTAPAEWLNRQEPGPGLDAAKKVFISQSTRADPEAAREWAETIADPAERARVLEDIRRFEAGE